MDPPECPVCLQAYDATSTIPRVLPCGHSACESCIDALPSRPAVPGTIRCPACNQTVRLLRPQGSSALPKNIDLLRLLSPQPQPQPQPQTPSPNPNPSPPEFIPHPWIHDLLITWKHWILPPDALQNHHLTLLPISTRVVRAEPTWFRPSYMVRVMDKLSELTELERDELLSLLKAAAEHRRSVCRLLGVWMDVSVEDSCLFLVCQGFVRGVPDGLDVREDVFGFGMVGLEICEAVMGLQLEGIVCGCLGVDCFCVDEYGHCVLDLGRVLLKARGIREDIKVAAAGRGGEDDDSGLPKRKGFVSPEVFVALLRDSGAASDCGYGSDVWSVASILAVLILGNGQIVVELFNGLCHLVWRGDLNDLAVSDLYEVWKGKVVSELEDALSATKLYSLLEILASCLNYDMERRPQVRDIWQCIRGVFVKDKVDDPAALDALSVKEDYTCCLALGSLSSLCKEAEDPSAGLENGCASVNSSDGSLAGNIAQTKPEEVDTDTDERIHKDGFRSVTLHGHQDCVTSLAIGGEFLFSSSFDKTVRVWSLKDFSLVKTLKGHEHKVMAIVVADSSHLLCISGDSGSTIFVWSIGKAVGHEALKKWNEHSDWRYSGIHSLAISETGYLYSGSGDKSIKAWSLKDYSLLCTMTGHRSTVSCLAVADGILYSGSWDGTIRLWSLSDHNPLSILGDDAPGNSPPVLALTVNCHILVSSYENGCLKLWKNDALMSSMQIQNGAIFALHMDSKLLFTGGWNKTINIQELAENELQVDSRHIASITCDSLITSLLYWHGKLFVGFSNKEIKYPSWAHIRIKVVVPWVVPVTSFYCTGMLRWS